MANQFPNYAPLPYKIMKGAGAGTPPQSASGGGLLGDIGNAVSSAVSTVTSAASTVVNRLDLIKGYANVVAKTWTDSSYLQKLLDDPASILGGGGMPTVPGAQVRVIQMKITGLGKVEEQVDQWIKGNETGQYDLYLPMKPDNVTPDASGGGDINCCCSPCCCCT
jgi:hypothetical protein